MAATATAQVDYQTVSGLLTFNSGETLQTISVASLQDDVLEDSETFLVVLSNATAIGISQSSATITIDDDEVPPPSISINSTSVSEGDAATLTVSLSAASAQDINVDYASSDGSATANSDYTPSSGTLTFSAGETSQSITITGLQDSDGEGDETYRVTLSNPVNATLNQSVGTVSIEDDDVTGPRLTVSDVQASEDDQFARVTISLSEPLNSVVRVDFQTVDGTATAGADYTARALGTMTFQAGQTDKIRDIQLRQDNLLEGNETLSLQISNAVGNATITKAVGTITIIDDDVPSLSILDPNPINEGQSTQVQVQLSGAVSNVVTVDYFSQSNSAIADVDFTSVAGSLTFSPGDTSRTITVNSLQDDLTESTEDFDIVLSNATNVSIARSTASVVIQDDDAAGPTISVSDEVVTEGRGVAVVEISLSEPQTSAVTLNYTTVDGSASAPSDYTARSGSLVFSPGQTVKLRNITIRNDSNNESNETFQLVVSNVQGASIQKGSGTIRINDND